jgi:hypothetical protein
MSRTSDSIAFRRSADTSKPGGSGRARRPTAHSGAAVVSGVSSTAVTVGTIAVALAEAFTR